MSVRRINLLPLSASSSLSACLSLSLIPSPPCFTMNPSLHSLIWITEYSPAYCAVTRHPYYRQPGQRDVGRRQPKTDALCHICNDRQQSAFRVPAFIMVNVDDTGSLPSWQTVTELSVLHNHRLGAAMITFRLMNANLFGNACSCVGGQKTVYACVCAHVFVSSSTVYSNSNAGSCAVLNPCLLSVRPLEAAQPWQRFSTRGLIML